MEWSTHSIQWGGACRLSERAGEHTCAQLERLNAQIERRRIKSSKACETLLQRFEQYNELDPLISTPEPSNPWISDQTDYWDAEKST